MLDLPRIPPAYVGNWYGVRLQEAQIRNARLFHHRQALANHCAGFMPPNPNICEIGVRYGDFSEILLGTFQPRNLLLVDIVIADIRPVVTANPLVQVLHGPAELVMQDIPDNSLDYLYIDGDHSYDGVLQDINIAHRVVKPGGIVQINDYTTFCADGTPYGVLEVTNSYIENYHPEILGLSLERSGYHDIALRIKTSIPLNYP